MSTEPIPMCNNTEQFRTWLTGQLGDRSSRSMVCFSDMEGPYVQVAGERIFLEPLFGIMSSPEAAVKELCAMIDKLLEQIRTMDPEYYNREPAFLAAITRAAAHEQLDLPTQIGIIEATEAAGKNPKAKFYSASNVDRWISIMAKMVERKNKTIYELDREVNALRNQSKRGSK